MDGLSSSIEIRHQPESQLTCSCALNARVPHKHAKQCAEIPASKVIVLGGALGRKQSLKDRTLMKETRAFMKGDQV